MLAPALTAHEAEEAGGAQVGRLAGGGCRRPRRPRRACTRTCSSPSSSASPVRPPCRLLDPVLAPRLQRGSSCGARRMTRACSLVTGAELQPWCEHERVCVLADAPSVLPGVHFVCALLGHWEVLGRVQCKRARLTAHRAAAVSGMDAGSVHIDNGTVRPCTPPRSLQAVQRYGTCCEHSMAPRPHACQPLMTDCCSSQPCIVL